ncbi:MAG: HNH endonuclease [Candidatus Angelobacter sp.]
MKLTPRERFLAKVCPEPGSGCWLWRGMVVGSGYGMARFERKMYPAHRLAWKLFCGEIAPGLVVCHKCDVRTCVNPEHLFLGTYTDNARDREEKGRSMRGEKNHSSKLSTEQVSRIKTALAEDRMYVSEIAREYGVTPSTIAAIAKGTTWRHVQAPATPKPELDHHPVDQTKLESTTPDHEL